MRTSMCYGIQTGRCNRDPSADLRGAFKTHKTKHLNALCANEIPEFLSALEKNEARLYNQTRRAIKLSMLLFVRPNELRTARWSEINYDAKAWLIPGEKMKTGDDHIVPLSQQALDLLADQKKETAHLGQDWVFPSLVRPRDPMSNGTVNVAIIRIGTRTPKGCEREQFEDAWTRYIPPSPDTPSTSATPPQNQPTIEQVYFTTFFCLHYFNNRNAALIK